MLRAPGCPRPPGLGDATSARTLWHRFGGSIHVTVMNTSSASYGLHRGTHIDMLS